MRGRGDRNLGSGTEEMWMVCAVFQGFCLLVFFVFLLETYMEPFDFPL